MNILENNLILTVNRSIEKAVENKLVSYGLHPGRDNYLNNTAGFEAKKADIKNRKGFCVDLFGHGAPQDRDTQFVPRVVIQNGGFIPGDLGNDAQEYFKKNDLGNFDKFVATLRSSHFRFDCHLVSNKSLQDSVLETIRSYSLPNLGTIATWGSTTGELFTLEYVGVRIIPYFSQGLLHKIYTYQILDVFETNPTLISRTVARIKEITVKEPLEEDNDLIIQIP